MTKDDFVKLLEATLAAVKEDDSFEGRIAYEMGEQPHTYVVQAVVRVGNSQGQGGVMMVQEGKGKS